MIRTTTARKNDVEFQVVDTFKDPSCPNGFFADQVTNGRWENSTFHVLDHYSNADRTYVDIGAWIGPTVLYAAHKFKKVLCFEADSVALEQLERNLGVNPPGIQSKVCLVRKALAEQDGTIEFGGNGELGNSQSTMMVRDPGYAERAQLPGQRCSGAERMQNITSVPAITLTSAFRETGFSPSDIGLMKMDIEGGEFFVVPAIQDFLREHQPPFYVSLHWVFLTPDQIQKVVDCLFGIYGNCYEFSGRRPGSRKKVSRKAVEKKQLSSLVFE